MAKALPVWLTKRRAAHLLIARLSMLANQYKGWQDARAAAKARKRYHQNPHD